MLTLVRTTRFGNCAAMRYTVDDPAANCGAVQFKFIKGVDVTVTQTETFWDSYCLANFSAAFLD